MRTLEFTEEQMRNLALFLNRTQLSGAEVPAYLEIIRVINAPIIDLAKKGPKLEDKPNEQINGEKKQGRKESRKKDQEVL
jgi:hypothetical protein